MLLYVMVCVTLHEQLFKRFPVLPKHNYCSHCFVIFCYIIPIQSKKTFDKSYWTFLSCTLKAVTSCSSITLLLLNLCAYVLALFQFGNVNFSKAAEFMIFVTVSFCCSLKCQIHSKIILCYFTVSIVVCQGMRTPELLQPVLSFINHVTVALKGALWEEEFIRQERDGELDGWSRLHWKFQR
jgi:hypothetical protein